MHNEAKKACAAALSKVLAETYVVYLKTHNFHWNVEGQKFHALHVMFEDQYRDMCEALDGIAERIRALGEYAPGTYGKLMKLSTIEENEAIPEAVDMLKELVADNETLVTSLIDAIKIVQDAGDEPSAGLLTDRQIVHEKQIWMMRSMLA